MAFAAMFLFVGMSASADTPKKQSSEKIEAIAKIMSKSTSGLSDRDAVMMAGADSDFTMSYGSGATGFKGTGTGTPGSSGLRSYGAITTRSGPDPAFIMKATGGAMDYKGTGTAMPPGDVPKLGKCPKVKTTR